MEIVEGFKDRSPTSSAGSTERAFHALCRAFVAFRMATSAFVLRAFFLVEVLQLLALTFFSMV